MKRTIKQWDKRKRGIPIEEEFKIIDNIRKKSAQIQKMIYNILPKKNNLNK